MNIQTHQDSVIVSGLIELDASNAANLRDQVRAALAGGAVNVDVDLSQTRFVDSSGLGALVALHKTACERKGRVRLHNPASHVQQILELTRLHRVFEIVRG